MGVTLTKVDEVRKHVLENVVSPKQTAPAPPTQPQTPCIVTNTVPTVRRLYTPPKPPTPTASKSSQGRTGSHS